MAFRSEVKRGLRDDVGVKVGNCGIGGNARTRQAAAIRIELRAVIRADAAGQDHPAG